MTAMPPRPCTTRWHWPDTSKASGYKFTQDGSRLWVSSVPAAGSRNIFTVLPGSSTLVPFEAAQVNTLDDYLGVNDPETLIAWVRSQPLGAILGSTPAFLDPPSLELVRRDAGMARRGRLLGG